MILYLDTSALVKLYTEEPGRDKVRGAVGEAETVAVSGIGYVEARSALARREREGSLSAADHDAAVERLKADFREVYLTRPLTVEVISRAGELTREHALRAYDAVHLATALILRHEAQQVYEEREEQPADDEEAAPAEVGFLTYDSSLAQAARREGLARGTGNAAEAT